jgi:sulfatase maturation enzyme AslB (radical SAM superfamily)
MNSLMEPKVNLSPQPTGMKHRFHAMVKPIGSLCNLNCTYCYYLHKEGLLHQPRTPRMSEEMLERHIRQYIEAASIPSGCGPCQTNNGPKDRD